MKVEKLSISLDHRLGDDVRAAAEREGASISSWLAEAARARLRRAALRELLDEWQKKHGAITPAELAKARAELGYAPRKRSAR